MINIAYVYIRSCLQPQKAEGCWWNGKYLLIYGYAGNLSLKNQRLPHFLRSKMEKVSQSIILVICFSFVFI